ncbi:MAG: nitrate reductase [Burkholderiaceae bacterium]
MMGRIDGEPYRSACAASPPLAQTRTTCPYCGVGCGVIIESRGTEIVGVRGDPLHPANFGKLCTKGTTLALTARPLVTQQVRAHAPLLRKQRSAPRIATDWETALGHVADRIAGCVERHGPDSVGIYISGQLLTEDYYVFNKLAKGLLGTNNIDSNSRLCMSSAVAGYKQTLGADSVPTCYEDIDHADLFFFAGSNAAYAHPVLYRRVEEARRRRAGAKTIVVDPRRTDTAAGADLHLQILPGTDVALFHGLLHLLLWEERIDRDFIAARTAGFAELKALVREYTPAAVAQICGVRADDVVHAAQWWGQARAVLSLYCQGLNQSTSGTAKNAALINLHLATGQIGRPGAGPFSLTGQPNAMGGREVGGMANLLSAHRDLGNAAHRAEVARLWGVDRLPAAPGQTAVEMFEAAARGEIKVLWIVCTNPAQSLPNQRRVRDALAAAELVIVQEAYRTTATAALADVLLPAATWGEKDGTVTNSERRICRVRRAVPPPGLAREDWAIVVEVARRIEARLRPGRPTLFPYRTPEQIWLEHRESTRGRDLDITGLSWEILERDGPQQWPYPSGASGGRARLYQNGMFATADGKARFVAVPYRPVAEEIDARFPLRLTTGRLRDQWHGMSRTGTLGRLFGHAPEPCIELHPAELARRMIAAGDFVHVTSRRGSLVLPAAASEAVRMGEAFIAMHWGPEFVAGCGDERATFGVNALTLPALDDVSKQPELKHAAVRIQKAGLPWHYVAFGLVPAARRLALQFELREHYGAFGYASCVPFGHDDERAGLLFRAAAAQPVAARTLAAIERVFGLEHGAAVFEDARRGVRSRLRAHEGRIAAAALAGPIEAVRAEVWLRELLGSPPPLPAHRLLRPGAQPPAQSAPRGRIVCNCFDVSEADIARVRATANGDALARVQAELKCGTNCGSCLPELRRLFPAPHAGQSAGESGVSHAA